jgi:nucleotide-binding universal stress UspA family protein
MFQRILVPLDGSARAERALPLAVRLAQASSGSIVLFRALSYPPELVSYMTFEPIAISPFVNIERAKAKGYLDRIAQTSLLSGIRVETEAVVGDIAPAILSAIDEHHSDLVVMSSHGYTGMKRWVMGSIAEKIARLSPVPVLMQRDEASDLASVLTPDGAFQALIPLDGSERAEEAIVPAGQLVAALSAPGRGSLHLLCVVVMPAKDLNGYSAGEVILQAVQGYIKATLKSLRSGQLANSLHGLGLSFSASITIDSDIAAGIARVAESGESAGSGDILEGADSVHPSQLIAMATHGYGGLQLLTMGSVTGRTLLATRLPLLIVRPPDMKGKMTAVTATPTEARK